MALLFVLGVALVLLAILLVGSALSRPPTVGGVTRSLAVLEAMTNAPKELTSELDRSFADRVIDAAPAAGARASGAGSPAPTPPSGSAASSTWPATRRAGPSTGSCPARSSARCSACVFGLVFSLMLDARRP